MIGVSTIPVDLTSWFNNPGMTTDECRGAGDFDGVGGSYPFADLAHLAGQPVGLAPESDGSGAPDNIVCEGQTLSLPERTLIRGVVVLGTAEMGSYREPLTLVAEDGRRVGLMLGLSDLAAGEPAFGEQCWALTSHYHRAEGDDFAFRPRLWRADLPVVPAVRAALLVLPSNPLIHVFGLALVSATESEE
jgi:hypothetical protein